jgi:hypothetical protein
VGAYVAEMGMWGVTVVKGGASSSPAEWLPCGTRKSRSETRALAIGAGDSLC